MAIHNPLAGKTTSVSLSRFLEIDNSWRVQLRASGRKQSGWGEEDTGKAWKRQVREAASWKKVKGAEGAFFCEVKDLGETIPIWQVWSEMIRMWDTNTEDVKK